MSDHYYYRDGRNCYEITGKNGKQRAPTIADARKMNLVPGYTAINNVLAKPQLQRWIIEQHVMAALTLPEIPGEDAEQRLVRILEDASAQTITARDRGTEIHNALEAYYEGQYVPWELEQYVKPVVEWITNEFPGLIFEAEHSFAHQSGYGGKVDLCSLDGTGVVIDFKTKDLKAGETKRLAYDDHAMQLAAYRRGIGKPEATCVNIFVSSTIPGVFYPVLWDEEDLVKALRLFDLALEIWKIQKGYESGWAP